MSRTRIRDVETRSGNECVLGVSQISPLVQKTAEQLRIVVRGGRGFGSVRCFLFCKILATLP